MSEDIRGGSQSHLDVNRRDTSYQILDCIKQRQLEWKGAIKSTQKMGKGSHKVFKTIVNEILQYLPPLGETDSEVSYFIPETRNFSKATKFQKT